MKKKVVDKKTTSSNIIPKKKGNDNNEILTYNKILNFEAQPGRFKIKETKPESSSEGKLQVFTLYI